MTHYSSPISYLMSNIDLMSYLPVFGLKGMSLMSFFLDLRLSSKIMGLMKFLWIFLNFWIKGGDEFVGLDDEDDKFINFILKN